MTELEKFVERELELKRTLSFGEWLRHIKQSHMDLLRLIAGDSSRCDPLSPKGKLMVEVFNVGPSGKPTLSLFSLPLPVNRVMLDLRDDIPNVWGFTPNHLQVAATLTDRKFTIPTGG